MPVKQLKGFLDRNNVKYVSITHSTAYTAQELAALTHTKGRDLAKTVIVKLDDALAMAVLPASYQIALDELKQCAGATTAALATETEFRSRFSGCETGAMPPFGNLYDMPVFVDESLTKDKEIAFNAGSHNELIRLAYVDFERLVNPKVLKFLARRAASHAA
jgi:Ala-tRNA(Pro) deacylase